MNILCLCPTYGRPPALIANSIALFQMQTHRAALLFIMDDFGNYAPAMYRKDCVMVVSSTTRSPTLSGKYNFMIEAANYEWDAIVPWDDDDVYLPGFLAAHAAALEHGSYSHPSDVYSNYSDDGHPGKVVREDAAGRFHPACAIRRDCFQAVGGYPDTDRMDFDQRMINQCAGWASVHNQVVNPNRYSLDHAPTYCMRWGGTAARHCSTQQNPVDTDPGYWYSTYRPQYTNQVTPAEIEPKLDDETTRILKACLERDSPPSVFTEGV